MSALATTDPARDLLVARQLRMEFGGLVACDDIDFVVPRGSIVSLIGPNGAGKTTFFNMLTGVYTPTAGEIVFDGQESAGFPPHHITALGIGAHLPEHPALSDDERARERARRHALPYASGIFRSILRTPLQRREERESRERATELLDYCGLPNNIEEEYARNLRYGDQRRLEVARALATRAEAAAARRADGRHEPERDRRASSRSCTACATSAASPSC